MDTPSVAACDIGVSWNNIMQHNVHSSTKNLCCLCDININLAMQSQLEVVELSSNHF